MSPTAPNRSDTITGIVEAFDRIRRLSVELAAAIEAELSMTLPQVQALEAVEEGARQVSDVTHVLMAHVSTASRVVDQLVTAGLVSRTPDPDDRRAVVLELTPAGRARLQELHEVRTRMVSRVVADFDPDEAERFTALLAKFADGIEATFGADHT